MVKLIENRGFVLLMGVLIVGAVGLAVVLALLFSGVMNMSATTAVSKSNQATVSADNCAQEALQQIRDSTSFSGSGNLSFSDSACQYSVINLGGQNRLVYATGTATGTSEVFYHQLEIIINTINPKINITSWKSI